MRRHTFFYRLFSFIIFIIISLVTVLTVFSSQGIKKFYFHDKINDLHSRAYLISLGLTDNILSTLDQTAAYCNAIADQTESRITLIHLDGQVIFDSHNNPDEMDNYSDRPEIKESIKSGSGSAVRYSHTMHQEMLYYSSMTKQELILRISVPVTSLNENIFTIRMNIFIAGLILIVIAAIISLSFSRIISKPLQQIRKSAKQFSNGDFTLTEIPSRTSEVRSLVRSLNDMASQIRQTIIRIEREKQEKEAILANLTEGILAVNSAGQIFSVNHAFALLFNIQDITSDMPDYHSILRNSQLIQFIEQILTGEKETSGFRLPIKLNQKYFTVSGARLIDVNNLTYGAVFVFTDITKIRQLEVVRKDFVSNVSHELKTPITTIQGFIETLNDVPNEDDRKKFLEIIHRNSIRLNSIIDDLLTLSKIESDEDNGSLEMSLQSVSNLFSEVESTVQSLAKKSNITLHFSCDGDIKLMINLPLMEQALENLITNAIKYSTSGSPVNISALQKEDLIEISVSDRGCGIESKHLGRVFERFYRVDKGRSRELGGTGLGLAIVKHIVNTHNGKVFVSSTINKGSIFTIHFPLPKEF